MRSIFGWSYPPGCSGPPDENECPCLVCGLWPDDCICTECPVCSSIGDPACYSTPELEAHGLVRTEVQIRSLAEQQTKWKAEADAEADYWAEQIREESMADLEQEARRKGDLDAASELDAKRTKETYTDEA